LVEITRPKSKRCEGTFISKMLVTGKFECSFDVVTVETSHNSNTYNALHVLEAKNYLVRMIEFELVNGDIPDDKIFRQVDAMVKLNSNLVLRYVTSWFEAVDRSKKDVGGSDRIALYIQSEACDGISLRELMNMR
jgi:hypothetical protein